MSLNELAEGTTDILLEILSGASLTSLLQLSLTTKSMHERVKKLTATDFFWKKWVLNSLFPHHHPDLIEKIPHEDGWHYYARLHGRLEATEVYWSGIADANGGAAGILSRFYPVYSSPIPLTVVKQHHRLAYLVALRDGILGFIAGKDILSGEWLSYPKHIIEGESYVDFFILSTEQDIQICLLTKLGRVYRICRPLTLPPTPWDSVVPLADIEGLDNSDIIVQINKKQFLDRSGQIHIYDGKKLSFSENIVLPHRPVARLGDDYLLSDPSCASSPIYFDCNNQYLNISLISSERKLYLRNWKKNLTENLALANSVLVGHLPSGVRGLSSSEYASAAWTVKGELFTRANPSISGNNRSSRLLAPAYGLPDFVVWAHVDDNTPIVALALPRDRDEKFRKDLEIAPPQILEGVMALLMFDMVPIDSNKVREFLLRERANDIQWLLYGIIHTMSEVELLCKYTLTDLREALQKHNVPNFFLYTHDQAANKLALVRRNERWQRQGIEKLVPLSRAVLQAETVPQLKKRAKDAKIKAYSRMKKDELIKVLLGDG